MIYNTEQKYNWLCEQMCITTLPEGTLLYAKGLCFQRHKPLKDVNEAIETIMQQQGISSEEELLW